MAKMCFVFSSIHNTFFFVDRNFWLVCKPRDIHVLFTEDKESVGKKKQTNYAMYAKQTIIIIFKNLDYKWATSELAN